MPDTSSPRTLWHMQNDFDSADTDTERERIRQEIRDAGYNGMADTIGVAASAGAADQARQQLVYEHTLVTTLASMVGVPLRMWAGHGDRAKWSQTARDRAGSQALSELDTAIATLAELRKRLAAALGVASVPPKNGPTVEVDQVYVDRYEERHGRVRFLRVTTLFPQDQKALCESWYDGSDKPARDTRLAFKTLLGSGYRLVSNAESPDAAASCETAAATSEGE